MWDFLSSMVQWSRRGCFFQDVDAVTCPPGFAVSGDAKCGGVDADFVSGFTTKLRRPCVHTRTVEFEHQPQLTLGFAQKDLEYKTNEVSEKSIAFSQVRADLDGATRRLSFINKYFDKLKPDCMVCSSASGSKRQGHNCNQQHKSEHQRLARQAAQEREKN